MSPHTIDRQLSQAIEAQVARQHEQGFHFGCSHRMSVVDEMEAWLMDCGIQVSPTATGVTIVFAIERMYDGGVRQFMADQS